MQTINQALATMQPVIKNQTMNNTEINSWQSMTHFTAQQANPQLVKVLAEMFTIWKTQYKTKMKEGAWDLLTAQIWAVALQDLGMTQEEYYTSYRKSLSLEWLPTTAYDFVALARKPIEQNYPDSHTAFVFACQNEAKTSDIKQAYDHVVIHETVKRLGSFALKNADDKYFNTWDKRYQTVCQEHANGADFTIPVSNQIEQKRIVADDEFVNQKIKEIKEMLGRRKS